MSAIVMYGAGGHGREILDLLEAINAEREAYEILGFVDDLPERGGTMVAGLPVLGSREWLSRNPSVAVVLAIGAPEIRARKAAWLEENGFELPALVHPTASVSRTSVMGHGSILMRGSSVSVDVQVGAFANINQMCCVGHDCRLGRFATLGGGVVLAGNVAVDEGAQLGVGAVARPGVVVGAWSMVGAGAAVVSAIEPDSVSVGVPARVIRRREPGWHLRG
jgi:sugar O-acyltransferase (sialic acid O-acetyltransferase NeuD family)